MEIRLLAVSDRHVLAKVHRSLLCPVKREVFLPLLLKGQPGEILALFRLKLLFQPVQIIVPSASSTH